MLRVWRTGKIPTRRIRNLSRAMKSDMYPLAGWLIAIAISTIAIIVYEPPVLLSVLVGAASATIGIMTGEMARKGEIW